MFGHKPDPRALVWWPAMRSKGALADQPVLVLSAEAPPTRSERALCPLESARRAACNGAARRCRSTAAASSAWCGFSCLGRAGVGLELQPGACLRSTASSNRPHAQRYPTAMHCSRVATRRSSSSAPMSRALSCWPQLSRCSRMPQAVGMRRCSAFPRCGCAPQCGSTLLSNFDSRRLQTLQPRGSGSVE